MNQSNLKKPIFNLRAGQNIRIALRFQITRNADNGLPETISTGGSFDISQSFNGFGEVNSQSVTGAGQSAFAWSFAHDDLGRISQKTETIAGQTITYDYTYDAAGTRISETNSLRGIAGRTFRYSDEDHLLTAGSVTCTYDPDGFLATKTGGTQVTTYTYSVRGELLQVNLPGGTVIDYIHDPIWNVIKTLQPDDVMMASCIHS